MNLTRQQEAEARKVYEKYWDSYSKGDLETFSSILDESFELIGTSESEVCHSKAEGIEFYKSQMQETVGRVEMRNRSISIKPVHGMFLVNETCDIYILSQPEWIFYSKIRLSTLLHETESGWKVIQQHGSFPDMRVQVGETMAFDKISKENQELRDAIKRATVELENKNRELAIETALEKVRAVAMGMKKPEDMLAICRTISEQLLLFGVTQIRNIQTALIDEEKGIYLCYQYFVPYDKEVVEKTEYRKSTVEHGMVRKMLASENAHFTNRLTGRELEEFREHRKAENHFPDPFLDEAEELSYCFLSIGQGGLGLTVYQPLDEATLDLFKRFHQVFSLAYQRFRDIKKSEAHTREVEIDLALERVRAQTMAMHNSEDMGKCIVRMFSELTALGVDEATRFGIGILNHNNENIQLWTARKDGEQVNMHIGNLEMSWHPLLKSARKAWKEQVPLHRYVLEGEDLVNYYQMINNAPDYKLQIAVEKLPEREFHYGFVFDHGFFYAFNPREFQPELILITQRFSSLFGQTYRRYLDLVKAEGQAREAEIELALERVRARTMAMQKSDELPEAANLLFQQVQSLGMPAWSAGYCTWDDDKKSSITLSMSSEGVLQPTLSMPLTKDPSLIHFREAWERGESFFVEEVGGEELKSHYTYLRSLPGVKETLDDIEAAGFPVPTFQIFHLAYFSKGFLLFITYQAVPEAHDIFKRFANVFEQTYTRFLDLQKAEAQAKESQIEAALEKVRSRSLAMHKSEELNEVVSILFEKIKELKIPATAVGIAIYIEGSKDLNAFVCGENEAGLVITNYRLPWFDNKIPQDLNYALEKQLDFFVGHYTKEEKDSFYKYVIEHIPEFRQLPDDIKRRIFESPSYTISMVAVKHAVFNINDFEGKILAENEMDIIKRFARVFDQAYTRFLDLQKAEAQAREAQIEAALERVRSRTMAMQSSSELGTVAAELFAQMNQLVTNLWTCGFVLCEKNRDEDEWWLSMDGDFTRGFFLPNIGDYAHATLYEGWLNGDALRAVQLDGETLQQHYDWLMEIPVSRAIFEEMDAAGLVRPDWQKLHAAYFSKGYLVLITREPCGEEEIFKRFAQVFDQTYTRFLDLQKAETQAREARIEVALERTRTQSMLMKHSVEIKSISNVFHEQLLHLGIPTEFSYVWLPDEANQSHQFWASWSENEVGKDILQSKQVTYPLDKTEAYTAACFAAWANPDVILEEFIPPSDIAGFFGVWQELLAGDKKLKAEFFPEGIYYSEAYMRYGCFGINIRRKLSAEEKHILKRFSKEFERAYTRFLDLQKAEAQTREAQIELGLERVRARAMAMQESGELSDLVATLLQELTKLDFSLTFCIINVYNEPDNSNMVWAANPEEGKAPESYYMKFEDYPFHHAMMREWKSQTPKFVYVMEGEEKAIYDDYLYTQTEFRRFPEEVQRANRALDKYVATFVFSHFGGLQTVGTEPLSDESIDILYRFGKVFDLTYTRFNDLQKAEAQAREAKIEAALERVRSRSMAMHKSEELRTVVSTLYGELQSLHVNFHVVAIQLIPDDSMDLHLWLGTADGLYDDLIHWPYINIPVINELYRVRTTGGILEYTISEADTRVFFDEYFKLDGVPQGRKTATQNVKLIDFTGAYQKLTGIFLMRYTEGSYSPSEKDIIRRFSKVFEQTYTRFLDLQKAEAQALEAIKRASVDRVRAEIASMRTITDLDRIQPLIWNELTILGVPFIRCGVFIMDEEKQEVESFLSTPDGKSIAAFRLSYYSTEQSKQIVSHWQQKQLFKDHMDEVAFTEFTKKLVQQGAMASDEKYVTENRPTDLYLHFLPFLQGMMYVGNTAPLKEDELQMVQNLADAFSTAYARYEDFNKLEAAKAAVDSAIGTLKATQAQLVQQEKLASLGQLTAGIAHEIKNPLNFVNNFTEVSIELMEEALVEIQKHEDQKDNALINHNLEDIKSNLKKVHGHSTRANSIVNSMLMHSRAGTGSPEPTPLNDFIREYCNLAFHGMRAANNPLNVHMILDLDERVKEIPIIAEDFSRVVLNICNNAFDAMRNTPKPMLTILTQLQKDTVRIQFKDNGPGIPDEIKDKILQPFFTTKKGKEGTGLGLSITNDIIKAHRGELTIDSQPGEGAAFIIHLPI